jgi:FAD/FMN-containing dehydrogenase
MPESSARHAVLSLGRMNAIRSIEPEDFSATVEAGCILSVVKDAVAAHGLFFPLMLGVQGAVWLFREGMVEGQAKRGMHLRTDVSVPLSRLSDFVREAETPVLRELPEAFYISYGHVGDGNMHLNVHPPAGMAIDERLPPIVAAKM